ncbi:hypothetical protein BJ165DRAFT_871261 [Panaeolus papilionaceus]|nr:hypothetical protein BJ165DRAFT_871261 [Panaeolus papilionaceus]
MSIHSPPASVSNLLTHLAHQLLLIHVCTGLALVLHWIVSGYSVILFLLLPCAYTLLAEPSSPSFSPTFSTMSLWFHVHHIFSLVYSISSVSFILCIRAPP